MHCVFGYVISGKQFVAYEKLTTVKNVAKLTFTKKLQQAWYRDSLS